MIALYRDGTSLMHRMPAGRKVLAIMLLVFLVSVVPHTWWSLLGAAVLVLGGYLLARLGVGELVRQVLVVRWPIVITLASQLLFLPLTEALTNTSRVIIVLLLAALISLTTRTTDLLDATERALGPLCRIGPFRNIGPDAKKIGIVLAMTITVIPVIAAFAGAIRDAQRARGAPTRPHAFVVPLLVMSMKHADDLGDAMIARGMD